MERQIIKMYPDFAGTNVYSKAIKLIEEAYDNNNDDRLE